ncbi:MAG: RpiB/LacA/LacB family sugar-phosphate isomerase [Candidatus Levybacteria bacterium]|nr:RpiB/LacA/LacB family sugar-phosphate isomerase [Candidatus Levybacteria bacterium]
MKIYLGADHRGFRLKEDLKNFLQTNGHDIEDCGALEIVSNDDYVDFAKSVAEKISINQDSRGIVVCGSGVGVDVVANKIDGIRCGLGFKLDQVKAARSDDDINVLALASDFTVYKEAKELVETFLQTEFNPTENHKRRIEKIKELDI